MTQSASVFPASCLANRPQRMRSRRSPISQRIRGADLPAPPGLSQACAWGCPITRRPRAACFLGVSPLAGRVAEFVCKLSGCRLSCHIRPSSIRQMAHSQKGQNQRVFVVLVVTLLRGLIVHRGRICLQIVRVVWCRVFEPFFLWMSSGVVFSSFFPGSAGLDPVNSPPPKARATTATVTGGDS